MNSIAATHSQSQKLLIQLRNIKCRTHTFESITKVCKHTSCEGQPPLCKMCLVNHDILHFSFLEDIDTLVIPKKIEQIREIALEMKRRLQNDLSQNDPLAGIDLLFSQIQECTDRNKAKLIDCFTKQVIDKRKEELKSELKTINDKIDRKFQLVTETKGGDIKMIQDFLKAYVSGMARFNELGELIRTQSMIAGTASISKKYLQEVQERFEGVKKSIKEKFQEVLSFWKSSETSRKLDNVRIQDPKLNKDETLRIEEKFGALNLNNGEDCEIIEVAPKKSMSRRNLNDKFNDIERETKLQKKLKCNPDQKPLAISPLGEYKMDSNNGRMELENRIFETKSSMSFCGENTMSQFSSSFNFEELAKGSLEDEIERNYGERLKKDYATCPYPKEIKDLLSTIFSPKTIQKYISNEINTRLLPVGSITKRNLQDALGVLSEILNILNNPNPSTSNAASQLERLSKDFYWIIPFNETQVLDSIPKLKRLLPVMESLMAIRVAMDILTGPTEESNLIVNVFKKLNCKIEILHRKTKEYQLIEGYLKATTPLTGKNSPFKEFSIQNIFNISRESEEANYPRTVHNKKLLWNALRVTDTAKILKNGFEWMAKELNELHEPAPHASFCDMISNCLTNCYITPQINTVFFFLCEVALGEIIIYKAQSQADKYQYQEGKSSDSCIEFEEGVVIPVKNPAPNSKRKCARYAVTEYNRIKIRFLVQCHITYT